ncbi:hypothetical protein [Phocaeicola sp.]
MKIIVWNSQGKRIADYHKLMGGCDVLCLLGCGQWEVPQKAQRVQNSLFHWEEEEGGKSYDILYCSQHMAYICRKGLYSGESIVYSVHSSIGVLVGIRLQEHFWLFANHEDNVVNSYHIGEFYLREISARFRKAAFVADFKERSYTWTQEAIGKLYSVPPPETYHPLTINYLFTIHVSCKDQYLIKGYEDSPNQPTFFEIEI